MRKRIRINETDQRTENLKLFQKTGNGPKERGNGSKKRGNQSANSLLGNPVQHRS